MASLPFTATPNPAFSQTIPKKNLKLTQTSLSSPHETDHTYQNLYKSYFHHISSLCKEKQIQEAVDLLTKMEHENFQIGPEIYGEILQGCVYERAIYTGQQIHARIHKHGDLFSRNEYIATKLVVFYAKCDVLDIAYSLFFRLRVKNVFSWAAIIGLYCRMGLCEEAIMGFVEMQDNGVSPDNFVVPNVLKACGALGWIGFGRVVHGYVMKVGFNGCVFVASSLIDMYGKCGVLDEARKVFDGMLVKNAVAWNSVIVGYVQNGLNEEAIAVFYDMRLEDVEVTRISVTSLLSASANLDSLEEGKQAHAIAVVSGMELDNILGSSIINFYSKVGLIVEAELVFSRMIEKDMVTWNLLIACYVQNGQIHKALNMCHLMRSEFLKFDCVTLASILAAAADTRDIKLGKVAHCYCIRNNLDCDMVVASSILDMYAKCERTNDAREIFNSISHRDIVMWNAILSAYANLGLSGETLRLFYQMQLEGTSPNVISWNSVILGFLRNGQGNEAKDMLRQMQSSGVKPDLITWTTLITGMSQNGFGDEAILFFQKMQEAGIKPGAPSITSALSACTDVTSLQNGRAIHGYVTRQHLCLLTPIATSLVDMYAKCGNIHQAKRIFDIIPSKELPVYNALISGYALHGQAVEALALYKCLLNKGIEPDSITFTNILYACSHAGLVNEGLEIFVNMVSDHNIEPSMEHYGCVVNLLSRCGNLDEAFKVILTMPYKPDAQIIGSLISSCGVYHETDLVEYLSKHIFQLEPDNPGNYVALSNAYASAGRWKEVLTVRDLMKEKGLKKIPGCSWIQIGGEFHSFVAGDTSHPKTEELYATLALLGMEMHVKAEFICG
ncbi:pentatricopeptide repeat-containing protein At5g55740, chloroplastic [Mangifera indica]|uniref:pentatricopeptide repeat-containing protein At5g55740, chloroplastic n=1 Tax=Mangifera indica TaxID=29780 RepID=UPI001CFA754E|nr:pentatricopeptide repeat-containing protein At5g55740, chloroplastic [Mangifera indica]